MIDRQLLRISAGPTIYSVAAASFIRGIILPPLAAPLDILRLCLPQPHQAHNQPRCRYTSPILPMDLALTTFGRAKISWLQASGVCKFPTPTHTLNATAYAWRELQASGARMCRRTTDMRQAGTEPSDTRLPLLQGGGTCPRESLGPFRPVIFLPGRYPMTLRLDRISGACTFDGHLFFLKEACTISGLSVANFYVGLTRTTLGCLEQIGTPGKEMCEYSRYTTKRRLGRSQTWSEHRRVYGRWFFLFLSSLSLLGIPDLPLALRSLFRPHQVILRGRWFLFIKGACLFINYIVSEWKLVVSPFCRYSCICVSLRRWWLESILPVAAQCTIFV